MKSYLLSPNPSTKDFSLYNMHCHAYKQLNLNGVISCNAWHYGHCLSQMDKFYDTEGKGDKVRLTLRVVRRELKIKNKAKNKAKDAKQTNQTKNKGKKEWKQR